MTTNELDLNNDIIDVRDIIARVEALEKELPDNDNEFRVWEHAVEFDTLVEILEDLKGEGGDEQWRGDWYPVILISEEYFTKYATELVCECHDLGKLPSFIHIDWEESRKAGTMIILCMKPLEYRAQSNWVVKILEIS